MNPAENLVIIGGACAGYTAGIYAARAQLNPLIYLGEMDGGQLAQTSEVENFPGFPEGIQGPELMQRFRAQAEKFGARIEAKTVSEVDFRSSPFLLKTSEGGSVRARAVIIATGAAARWLNLASEQRLRGKGVSACATCDGFFFKGKEIAVVGGGDSAMEEALFLTRFASKVTIIHRRDAFRASKIMLERAGKDPKIAFLLDSTVEEVLGENKVEGLKIKNKRTGGISAFACQGLFLAVGHEPNTGIFKGHVELDEKGYVVCRNHTRTSVEGIFAAGDVRDPRYKQAVSAAGSGCMAAIDAAHYLAEHEAA